MKAYKRIIACGLAALMAVSITACGKKDKEETKEDNETSEVQVETKEQDGITIEEIATPVPSEEPEQEFPEIEAIICNTDGVNVRAENNTDCEILTTAYDGDVFKLKKDDSSNGWYEVEYNGESAFISSEFSRKVTMPEDDFEEALIVGAEDYVDDSEDDDNSGVKAETTRENEDGQKR